MNKTFEAMVERSHKLDAVERKLVAMADAAEMLWVVLANVSGGDWEQQTPEWQEAAARGRDNYFAALKQSNPNPPQEAQP